MQILIKLNYLGKNFGSFRYKLFTYNNVKKLPYDLIVNKVKILSNKSFTDDVQY